LLDEATSALDSESEFIRNVDQIAVLDQGEIIATGNHEQLQKTSTLYQRLSKLQFRGHD